MLIQAYRRKSESTHEINDTHYKFAKNDRGHFVCDVDDDAAVDRFLSIDDAFKPYGDEVAPRKATTAATKPKAEASKFVLINGDTRIDLGSMSDEEVKAFAKAQALDGADLRKRGDALRQSVLDAVKAASNGDD